MRPLRIAQVAPVWARVPPVTYGGTERIVYHLTEELVRRGHDVTLFASGDSLTSARLRPCCELNLFDGIAKGEVFRPEFYTLKNLADAVRDADSFDIIHCHLGCFSLPFSRLTGTPVLHTLPSVLGVDELWMLQQYPEAPVIARSHRQIADVSPERRGGIRVIYNGHDFDAYEVSEEPGRYLAFLGRMAWEKSPLDAIQIAKKAEMPIVLAGEPWYEGEHEYFAEYVEPHIDGKDVVYLGAVNDAQKRDFLKRASALLFPIQYEEPLGNVMIEAMACGVPVVARNMGSVSEVVDPGRTGFYADAVEDLPALVREALLLDRKAVRDHARRRFSRSRMADDYLRVYETLDARLGSACTSTGAHGTL